MDNINLSVVAYCNNFEGEYNAFLRCSKTCDNDTYRFPTCVDKENDTLVSYCQRIISTPYYFIIRYVLVKIISHMHSVWAQGMYTYKLKLPTIRITLNSMILSNGM